MLKHWKLALVAASLLFVGRGVALARPSGSDQGQDPAPTHHQRDGQNAGKRGDVKRGKDGKRGEKRAAMLGKYDTNKDGKLDATEKEAMQKDKFARLDKNHDGVLSFDEAKPLMARHASRFHHQSGKSQGGRDNKMQKQ